MKFIFVLTMFFAFNAEASDPPKADGKKAERSAVPERITRPKPSPDSLPQQVEKNSNPNACPKFEYKDKPAKIVCLEKATGNDKPKPAAKCSAYRQSCEPPVLKRRGPSTGSHSR